MHQEQRTRAAEYFTRQEIHRALLAAPATVTWLSGFVAPIEVGPHPFQSGPPMIWYENGAFTLILVEGLAAAGANFAAQPGCGVRAYEGYTILEPVRGWMHLQRLIRTLTDNDTTEIAIEERDISYFVANILPGHHRRPIDGWTEPLRVLKTPEELVKLRENFRLTDIAHIAAREAVRVGAAEIDVYLAARGVINRAAGERVPIGNDFVVGSRENNISGWPSDKAIRAGDSFIADISTIRFGYWSDSCATYYASGPSAKQRQMHEVVMRALGAGKAMLRPGGVARDVDAAMRQVISEAGYPEYPHHGGHGVGVTPHEAPRIVPYNEEALEAGMVVMLEPGIYLPGETSVRLEDAMLITETGYELLTHHDKGL